MEITTNATNTLSNLYELPNFAAFAAITGDQLSVVIPAGGLNSGYSKAEIKKWRDELEEVVASGVGELTEKMGVLPSGQEITIVFAIDGDTLEDDRYTAAVFSTAQRAHAAGHNVNFLVTTSPCMQWGENALEDFRSFVFPVYRVSVSYADIRRTAAFLEEYAFFGDAFYGPNETNGEKFTTTFAYFFLAAYAQCALPNVFAACPNVVIMPKTYLVDQAEQLERVHAFRNALRDNVEAAIKGGITFLELMFTSPDARKKFPIASGLPTLQQLIECCVCKKCGKAQEGPYDACFFGPLCTECETLDLWADW